MYCRGLPASPPRAARLHPPPPVPWSQRSSSCTRHGQSLPFHHALGTTDSLQESRRPRDQFLLSRSAGISPACCPSPSSSLHPGRGSPPNSPLEPLSSSSDRRDSPLVWAAPESMSASGGEVERERNEGVEEGGDAPGALPSAPFATAQRRFGEKKHKPKNH